jgi:hypothetical protein
MSQYNVKFWTLQKSKIEYNSDICFRNLSSDPYNRIVYLSSIDKDLTKKEVLFYLNFLDLILDKNIYKYKLISCPKFKNHVMFSLNTNNLNRKTILLYLTAFRYPDEVPEILKTFNDFKETDIEKLFIEFQRIHFDYNNIKFKKKNNNLSGHGLMSYCFSSHDFTYISLEEFKDKLSKQKEKNIQDYFKSDGNLKLGDKYKKTKIDIDKVKDKV